jgi:hypothetical protein
MARARFATVDFTRNILQTQAASVQHNFLLGHPDAPSLVLINWKWRWSHWIVAYALSLGDSRKKLKDLFCSLYCSSFQIKLGHLSGGMLLNIQQGTTSRQDGLICKHGGLYRTSIVS